MEQYRKFKENAIDKMVTEFFLQNLIINISDILLVVVGELTYSEQLLLNKIKEESKKQNKRRIFIIHNLKEFRTKEQVEDYIKNSLLKCSLFDLKKRTWISTKKDEDKKDKIIINGKEENEIKMEDSEKSDENMNIINLNDEEEIKINPKDKNIVDDFNEESKLNKIHFTEIINYGDKKQLEIYHLILANEDSEAGKIYNEYTYNFIENFYNLIEEPKISDIFQQIRDNFKELSNIIILNNNLNKFEFNGIEKIIKDKRMKLDYKEDLILKKIYRDGLGFSFFKTDNFEPKYNYFKPDEKTLEIRIEIPGNSICEISHEVKGDKTIITVKGIKKRDNQPEKLKYNLFNIREFSEFELNIPLKTEYFQINQTKPKEGYPKLVNGICLIQYELAQKGEKIEIQTEEVF